MFGTGCRVLVGLKITCIHTDTVYSLVTMSVNIWRHPVTQGGKGALKKQMV